MNDPLMTRYFELCQTQNIPDMERYAQSWYVLAGEFIRAFRLAMAEACIGRWKQYIKEQGGEYVRLIEQPFSELILVEAK
jgi:hypothetical protein